MSTLGERGTWRDGDFRISQCAVCRSKQAGAVCSAFPDGIPSAILRNEVSHADEIAGDGGLRLEPVEISLPLFEQVTGLSWPSYSVAYDQIESALAARDPGSPIGARLADLLVRAELLLPRAADTEDDALAFTTVATAEGGEAIPLFTSLAVFEEYFGSDPPKRARLALAMFRNGIEGIPVVLDPGTGMEVVFDPAEVVALGESPWQ